MTEGLQYGDLVAFQWGSAEVHGTVAEVYGPDDRQRVVIALDPETTGYMVAEPTTVALPVERVHRVVSRSAGVEPGTCQEGEVHDDRIVLGQ